jgi:hypothetical protein
VYNPSKEDTGIFTKVTSIEPQFVVVNSTKSLLNVAQSWIIEERHLTRRGVVLNLDPNERNAFHWSDVNQKKLIKFRIEQPGTTAEWSSPFDIEGEGTIFCQNWCKTPGSSDKVKRMFKVTRQ